MILSFEEKEGLKRKLHEFLGLEGVVEIQEDISFYDESRVIRTIKKGWRIVKEKESEELFLEHKIVFNQKPKARNHGLFLIPKIFLFIILKVLTNRKIKGIINYQKMKEVI